MAKRTCAPRLSGTILVAWTHWFSLFLHSFVVVVFVVFWSACLSRLLLGIGVTFVLGAGVRFDPRPQLRMGKRGLATRPRDCVGSRDSGRERPSICARKIARKPQDCPSGYWFFFHTFLPPFACFCYVIESHGNVNGRLGWTKIVCMCLSVSCLSLRRLLIWRHW